MSLRLCCCSGSESEDELPCQPCPTPISPCTKAKYRVEVWTDIVAVAAGDGMLASGEGFWGICNFLDQSVDCMEGDCSPAKYKRNRIYVQDYSAGGGVCADPAAKQEQCDHIAQAQDGPTLYGHHVVEWSVSPLSGATCEPLTFGPLGNVTYDDQSDGVYIDAMYVDQRRWGCQEEDLPGCYSLLVVRYVYEDTYATKRWFQDPPVGGECTTEDAYHSVYQEWTCTYAKQVQLNNKVATGWYRLVYAQTSLLTTVTDVADANGCYECNQAIEVCAPTYADAPIMVGTEGIWHPPKLIRVLRIC